MEILGTQNSRDDRMSACRNIGSNYHGCSQSRKISIGVMVDSLDKWRPKNTNEKESAVPSNTKTFKKPSSISDLSEKEKSKASGKENQINQDHSISPWVSPKSTHSRKPTSDAVNHADITNDSPAGEKINKSNKVQSGREGDEEEKREGKKGLEREVAEDKGVRPEERRQVLKMKLWEILGANSLPNKQASQAPEVGINNLNPDPEINQKCESVLKPKQNSDTIESDSQSFDTTIKRAVTRSLTRKKVSSKAPKSKIKNVRKSTSTKKSLEKNIFSFNEGQFGKVYEAAAGRSYELNRKNKGKRGSKVEAHKINFHEDLNAAEVQPQISKSKIVKGAEKTSSIGNIMRNYQNSPPNNHSDNVGSENINKKSGFSLLSAKKKGGKGLKEDAPRSSFSDKLISDKVQPEIDISEKLEGANKASLVGNINRSYSNISPQKNNTFACAENKKQEKGSSLLFGMKRGRKGSEEAEYSISFPGNASEKTKSAKKGPKDGKIASSFRNSLPEKNSRFADAKNRDQEKDSSLLAAQKLDNISFLKTPHNWVQKEAFGTSPLKKTIDPQADLQSPIFNFRTPAEEFSPGSLRKVHNGDMDDQSPGNYSFNSPLNFKPSRYTPDAKTGTSNETEDDEDSLLVTSGNPRGERDADDKVYGSSPEKMDSESSKKGWAPEKMSPDIGSSRNSEFMLYPNKRLRSQENLKFQRFSPILASPEGSEESDGSQGPPENNEENGLANAISLLALALQRVQSKIKSITSKKSTEVLMSVAEEVRLQVQNAESQFEKDVGKLRSLNKSKRKQLETEFEEQQEQLKGIYQKFKADVSQHIQEHRSKVEGLQGQEKEFRLFMEKRKASQKEVLKQLEESIQTQLSDAETRIAAVKKTEREKILQLKQALGKCLKEGMLG